MRMYKMKRERQEEALRRKLQKKEEASSNDGTSSDSIAASERGYIAKTHKKFSRLMSFDLDEEMKHA